MAWRIMLFNDSIALVVYNGLTNVSRVGEEGIQVFPIVSPGLTNLRVFTIPRVRKGIVDPSVKTKMPRG